MSSICGYYYIDASNISDTALPSMVHQLNHWQADKEGKWSDQQVGLGHLMLYNTPESLSEVLPYLDTESNTCITADARIDNRAELTKKFQLTEETTKQKADSWFILTAYQKWGEECTQHLEGDFAFAIWDKPKQKMFCARDQIGIKPFYYYFKDGVFAFATEMKGILALNEIDTSINKKWIAGFLVNVRFDRSSSFYQHIHRLEAAHQLVLVEKKIRIKKYWELDIKSEIYFPNESDYIIAFLEKLDKAVSKRLRSNWGISSELSGGIDSSLVTAVAQKLQIKNGTSVSSISDVMPNPIPHKDPLLYDDRKQIQETIKHLQITNYHFVTGEEKTLVDSFERAVSIHDEPPIKFINIFADLIYEKTALLKSRVLLSGFGGNEVVSYRGYFFHEELFRKGKWKTLWQEIKAKTALSGTSATRRLVNTIISSFTSVNSENYLYYKFNFSNKKAITKLKNVNYRSSIVSPFFKQHLTEKQILKQKLFNYKGKTINEKISNCLSDPRILNNRLEYCNLSAAHNKVEIRYPLLDIELIQFFISLPSTIKLKNGWSRYLFRTASKDLIPENISWLHVGKGSSSPSYLWRMYRDKKLFIDALRALPKESQVNEYIDKKSYIEHVERMANLKEFNNYGGQRLFLLQKILDRINSEK